ncbi:acyltransferase family protein [Zavarzinella formosa]|uniref:acyltransferase family protein n=1 Tax=Zavarzinella formosa TaxID=360055 RepID=UPI0003809394|nr:acyltransferase family protein [Zavarzinella formosa]
MSQHISYRPDIDGLRAVAVLSVVIGHAQLGLPGGFVGVDVFFVISGYLIAGLIRKDLQAGTFSLVDFWMRRIRRILPALAVVTAATITAGWFILLPQDYVSLARSVRALLLMFSNMYFMQDTGYFQQTAEEKPLLHTWSLAVEEQFYLVVPLVLMLLVKMRRERPAVVLLSLALIASFAVSVIGTHRFPVTTFYIMPARAWELLVGTLLAYRPMDKSPGGSLRRELAAFAGLAAIVTPAFLYDQKTLFPGWAALPPVAGAGLLIWAGGRSVRRPLVNRFLSARPVVFVGLISYSLYLWHWPLIVYAKYASIYPLSDWERLGLVGVSLVAGFLSWRLVETPFRTKKLLGSSPRLIIGTLMAVAVLFAGVITVLRTKGFDDRLTADARRFVDSGQLDRTWVHELEAADIPGKLVVYGDRSNPVKLLVWGDSFAMAALPAIASLSQKTGVTVCAATRPQTAPVVNFIPEWQQGRNEGAIPFNNAVMNHIRTAKIPAVLLIGVWSSYLNKPEAIAPFLQTIDDLNAAGVRIYFMREIPTFPFELPRSLVRYHMMGRDISELSLPDQPRLAAERFYASILPRLTERGVAILDPLPYLRTADNPDLILPYDSGGSLYRDSAHLSPHGAKTIEPLFAPMFDSITHRCR